jgi:hypothetical protein
MKPARKGEADNNVPSEQREREIHPKNKIKRDCVFGTPNPPQPKSTTTQIHHNPVTKPPKL